ncbi:MAG: restriction endonuclease [Ottowia sp.]|nr:restriction endonuclease [Ottowia sp.]
MAIPDFQEFMLPLLRLAQQQKEVRLRDAVERLAKDFKLDEQDLELCSIGGHSVFYQRVAWAKTYMAAACLLEAKGRGVFAITQRGREVLQSQVQRIDRKYLSQFREFAEFAERRTPSGQAHGEGKEAGLSPTAEQVENDEKDATPGETIREAIAALEDALAQELLERILAQSPGFFERLTVKLLVAMGYGGSVAEAGEALGKSGDGGVDGVIKQDELGLSRIYVQAKRYARGNVVGAPEIRNFSGALNLFRASSGLFVTTSSFTSDAMETAKMLGQRIVLIDGQRLVRLMIRYGVGCREEETLVIKKLDEDFFEEL